jgi:outer membrane protein OmpA-like peptidoglycan-associated protein
MKRLIFLPLIILCLEVYSQEKLIKYNDYYLKNIKIEELPTNTKLSDFGPCLVNSELFFTSFNDQAKSDSKKENSKFYYQLFSVQVNNIGKVTSMRHVISDLAAEYHVGPNSYDKNRGELMVTRNNADDPSLSPFKPVQKKALNLEMILAKKENGKWKYLNEFNQNNKEYSVGHPAFTPSGDTLIFASDMPGGFGETDLYMSVRLSDGWSSPKNLGPQINSSGKEFTPFVTNDGILIFASNGMEGKADLDLYYTLLNNEGAPTIVKFPAPINSDNDDFGMIVNPNNVFGYFTSNRPGTGSDDIYRIDFNITLAKIKGKVVNKITGKPINQASVEFNPAVVNPEVIYTDAEGLFEVETPEKQVKEAIGSKEGYKTETVKVKPDELVLIELMPEIFLELSTRDAETKAFLKNVSIDFNGEETLSTDANGLLKKPLGGGKEYYIRGTLPGYLDNSITIGAEGEPGIIKATLWMYKGVAGKTFTLENIYYDFDKWDILPQSAIELDKLVNILKENGGIKTELGSHTDSRGTDEYNLWLSNKRSQSAVDYIIGKGIPTNNIIAKGYGESQPFIATPANEAEHRMNRRTTFTILEVGTGKTKIQSVASDQSRYGKYSVTPQAGKIVPIVPVHNEPSNFNIPPVKVTGKNYRVQFYASKKPININTAMSEIVGKFSQYGLINLEEDFLIKYQIGPFTDINEGTLVYNKIRDLGYQVMLLEYLDTSKVKMVLPN